MAVRFAVMTFLCVSAAPRGMTSTAAVEMTANGSSGDTSGPGGTLARRYSAARGLKPGPPASPNWYQCATAGFASGQPATTGSVAASTTIIRGAARSTTRATSWAVSRQLTG